LREEGRLRLFENKVLGRIFGPKRDEVTGEWRKLYNMKLNDVCVFLTKYFSGDQFIKNEMGGACSMYVERKGVYRVLVRKPGGKKTVWKTQA
jgi:hypothetical protein